MKPLQNCIYKITFDSNNKVYIGQARCSIERWGSHINNLIYDKHPNKNLTEIYKKDGLDAFNFTVIKSGLTEDEMNSEELLAISEIDKDLVLNHTSKLNRVWYKLDWETYNIYEVSLKSLIKDHGLTKIKIWHDKIYGSQKSCTVSEWVSIFKDKLEAEGYLSENTRKTIVVTGKDTNKITKYTNIRSAAAATGYTEAQIRLRLSKNKSYEGDNLFFSYLNSTAAPLKSKKKQQGKAVQGQLGDIIKEFSSLKEAARYLNVAPSVIKYNLGNNKAISSGPGEGWAFVRI